MGCSDSSRPGLAQPASYAQMHVERVPVETFLSATCSPCASVNPETVRDDPKHALLACGGGCSAPPGGHKSWRRLAPTAYHASACPPGPKRRAEGCAVPVMALDCVHLGYQFHVGPSMGRPKWVVKLRPKSGDNIPGGIGVHHADPAASGATSDCGA